ncbi:hypothetical protein [Micrococcus luteus]|uniref:hypothetical protein n=1 Tax=Micrococcus luteus TaxID=1270 RepID=UPI00254BD18A|nr:hypothetical protein [Micrococcus luteus]MDK8178420.1 hypothetical protein [Micrococcus luteus]
MTTTFEQVSSEEPGMWTRGTVVAPPRVVRVMDGYNPGPAQVAFPIELEHAGTAETRQFAEVVMTAGEVWDEPTRESSLAVGALRDLQVGERVAVRGESDWIAFEVPEVKGPVQVKRLIPSDVTRLSRVNGEDALSDLVPETRDLDLRREDLHPTVLADDWENPVCPHGVFSVQEQRDREGQALSTPGLLDVRPVTSAADAREALWTTPAPVDPETWRFLNAPVWRRGVVTAEPRLLLAGADDRARTAYVAFPLEVDEAGGDVKDRHLEVLIEAGEVGGERSWEGATAVAALREVHTGDRLSVRGRLEEVTTDGPRGEGTVSVSRMNTLGLGNFQGWDHWPQMGPEYWNYELTAEEMQAGFTVKDVKTPVMPRGDVGGRPVPDATGQAREAERHQERLQRGVQRLSLELGAKFLPGESGRAAAEKLRALEASQNNVAAPEPGYTARRRAPRRSKGPSEVDHAAKAMERGEIGGFGMGGASMNGPSL